MTKAQAALKQLQEGNQRFVEGNMQHRRLDEVAKIKMSSTQNPFAIILGCSDARVPAEMIFDQGVGDLFVIRVAGNIVAPSQVGSIEYAVKMFGTALVVVLGHADCGAVAACIESIQNKSNSSTPNLYSIVERIRPAIHTLAETPLKDDPKALIKHAVRANIRASVANLRYSSPALEQFISSGELSVVGAECSLDSGIVEFFEGVPDDNQVTMPLGQ